MAGSVCGSSTRLPFTCLDAIPPVVATGHTEHVSRGRADLVAVTTALAFIVPAKSIAGPSRHALQHAADPLVSRSWLRSGGEMLLKIAFVLLIPWLLGVIGLYRIGSATSCMYCFWSA